MLRVPSREEGRSWNGKAKGRSYAFFVRDGPSQPGWRAFAGASAPARKAGIRTGSGLRALMIVAALVGCRVDNPAYRIGEKFLGARGEESTQSEASSATQEESTSPGRLESNASTSEDRGSLPSPDSSRYTEAETTSSSFIGTETTSVIPESSSRQASSSVSTSSSASTSSSTSSAADPFQLPCPTGAVACYSMKPNSQSRALDEGTLGQDIQLSAAKLLSASSPNNTITDNYARFDGSAQENSSQYNWPDIGKGIGADAWIRFRPCAKSICSVVWLREFFIIKIDSLKKVSCETLDGDGKLVLPEKIAVNTGGTEFSHVACRYFQGSLQLKVDDSEWKSKAIQIATPASLTTSLARISIPGVENPFDGDLAGLRIWNDAEALKNSL